MSQFEITMHSIENGRSSDAVTMVLQDAGASAPDREHTRVVSYAEDVHWEFATMHDTRLRDVVASESRCLDKWLWEYDRKELALPKCHTVEFYGFEASMLRETRNLHNSSQPACLGGEGSLWPDRIARGDSWEEMIGCLLANNPYRWDIKDVNRLLAQGGI